MNSFILFRGALVYFLLFLFLPLSLHLPVLFCVAALQEFVNVFSISCCLQCFTVRLYVNVMLFLCGFVITFTTVSRFLSLYLRARVCVYVCLVVHFLPVSCGSFVRSIAFAYD